MLIWVRLRCPTYALIVPCPSHIDCLGGEPATGKVLCAQYTQSYRFTLKVWLFTRSAGLVFEGAALLHSSERVGQVDDAVFVRFVHAEGGKSCSTKASRSTASASASVDTSGIAEEDKEHPSADAFIVAADR